MVAEALAVAERQREIATRQLVTQQQLARGLEGRAVALEAEIVGLEDAVCCCMASMEREAHAARVAHDDAIERLEAQWVASERGRATAAADASRLRAHKGSELASARAEAEARAATDRTHAEANLESMRRQLVESTQRCESAAAEATQWRAQAEAANAHVARLWDRIRELEAQRTLPTPPTDVAAVDKRPSRFAAYVSELDHRAGRQRDPLLSAGAPPPPPPLPPPPLPQPSQYNSLTGAARLPAGAQPYGLRPAVSQSVAAAPMTGAAGLAAPSNVATRGGASRAAQHEGVTVSAERPGSALRPARQRGGALLSGAAAGYER